MSQRSIQSVANCERKNNVSSDEAMKGLTHSALRDLTCVFLLLFILEGMQPGRVVLPAISLGPIGARDMTLEVYLVWGTSQYDLITPLPLTRTSSWRGVTQRDLPDAISSDAVEFDK